MQSEVRLRLLLGILRGMHTNRDLEGVGLSCHSCCFRKVSFAVSLTEFKSTLAPRICTSLRDTPFLIGQVRCTWKIRKQTDRSQIPFIIPEIKVLVRARFMFLKHQKHKSRPRNMRALVFLKFCDCDKFMDCRSLATLVIL